MEQLSHIGIYLRYKSTSDALDEVRSHYDVTAKQCKANHAQQLSSGDYQIQDVENPEL